MRIYGKSILTKLISIYLLMAFMLIGVLGFTIANSCRTELLKIRMKELIERAQAIGKVISDDVPWHNNEAVLGVLQSISQEYDAVLTIADAQGSIVLLIENERLNTGSGNITITQDIMQTLLSGKPYTRLNYYNSDYRMFMSTAAIPVFSDYTGSKIEYIVILHSDNSVVQDAYLSMLGRFWIPCIAILMLCVLLILFFSYGLSLPLTEMNSVAKEISHGNFEKRVLVTSRDEVGQLAESFNKMAAELAITDAKRTEFIANISHELRTPLTSINGFVQGMLDGTIPESEHRRYLEIVLAESKRLNKLTREMLDLSRIETGRFPMNRTDFDLNELIRRVIITESSKLDEKNIDLDVNFEDERLYVNADAEGIEQVCVNLLDNAIKFTDNGKSIKVQSRTADGKAEVTISDEGCGIPESDLPHIWEKFYTQNKSRTKGGMGLGLSIVKRIILEHGQDITVKSKLGEGTDFTFTLDISKVKRKENKR